MKRYEKTLGVVVAFGVLFAACSSGSGGEQVEGTAIPTVADVAEGSGTPTPGGSTTTTSEPTRVVEVDDDALIAAALAAYEANPAPEGTIAWDVLDSSVFEDTVSFTMCTWDGLSASDVIRDVKFVTTVDTDGSITARNVQASPTAGDCLNTQLITTAIATVNFHDDYWASVASDPATFNEDMTAAMLYTDPGFQNFETLARQWSDADVYLRGLPNGGLPSNVITPILWRTYTDSGGRSILGLVTCRELEPEYGLYRDGVLLDDFKSDPIDGTHVVDEYRLVPDLQSEWGWRLDGTDGLVWAACLRTTDWVGAINDWKPEPTVWREVPS